MLLTVAHEGREGLVGRTLLQKKAYFASLLTGQDQGFRPHYYGPYSQLIAGAADSLVGNRFLQEEVHIFPDTNMFGEIRRHTYKLTEDGRRLLESVRSTDEGEAWLHALDKINSHAFASDFQLLSIAAKVSVITRRSGAIGAEQIRQRARSYGWNLSDDEIKRVAEFVAHLGLQRN